MRQRLLLIVLCLWMPSCLGVEVGVRTGSYCSEAVQQIRDDWFTLKERLVPPDVRITRPGSGDLYCIAPNYVRTAVERPTTSQMRCFTFQGSDDAFCCTGGLSECAALNPAAIAEAKEKEKERAERRAARKAKKEAKKAAKLAKENNQDP
ncbi:MAG: hypothetical protein AAF525_09190 [Pseudomonadota bacterium]